MNCWQHLKRWFSQIYWLAIAVPVVAGCNSKPHVDAVIFGGSMAPTMVGDHFHVVCNDCRFEFDCNANNVPGDRLVTCPNCGFRANDLQANPSRPSEHARILPLDHEIRRWEVVAFRYPDSSKSQSPKIGVKRVVCLPSESLQIREGDLWIDGNIAVKPLSVQREMRIPVFDSKFSPATPNAQRLQTVRAEENSNWIQQPNFWQFSSSGNQVDGQVDCLECINWRCCRTNQDRQTPTPVEDYYAYNQNVNRTLNPLNQIFVRLEIEVSGNEPVNIQIDAMENCQVTIAPSNWKLVQHRGDQEFVRTGTWKRPSGKIVVEVSNFDRQVLLLLNNEIHLQEAAPLGAEAAAKDYSTRLVRIMPIQQTSGSPTSIKVHRIQVWRDVYYFDQGPARYSGGGSIDDRSDATPESQDAGYLMLGDNVPISLDSRIWTKPRIPSNEILGFVKPGE